MRRLRGFPTTESTIAFSMHGHGSGLTCPNSAEQPPTEVDPVMGLLGIDCREVQVLLHQLDKPLNRTVTGLPQKRSTPLSTALPNTPAFKLLANSLQWRKPASWDSCAYTESPHSQLHCMFKINQAGGDSARPHRSSRLDQLVASS